MPRRESQVGDTAAYVKRLHDVLLGRGRDDEDQIRLEVACAQLGAVSLSDYFTPMQATYNSTADTARWQRIEVSRSIPDAHRAFYAAGNTPVLSLDIANRDRGNLTVFTPTHIRESGFLSFLVRDLDPHFKLLDEALVTDEQGVVSNPYDEPELVTALECLEAS